MTRAEAEKRIKKAAPWAQQVDVFGDYITGWFANAQAGFGRRGRESHIGAQVWGRTKRAAVERLERILASGGTR